MSQSDTSEDSTTTVHEIRYIDMTSIQEGEDEDEDEIELTIGNLDPTAIITKEEIEEMIACMMRANDNHTTVMNVLLHLNEVINKYKQ